MGFIYRKTIPVTRTAHLNVSKSGVSTSVKLGPVTLNSRGRLTIHLGKGASWRLH